MKKIYFYLFLLVAIASCDKTDELPSKSQSANNSKQLYIINGDIEYYGDIEDGSKPKKPIFIYDTPKKITQEEAIQETTSKTSEQSVSINFGFGIANPTNSGCTIDKYIQSTGTYYTTNAGVYGPNPYAYPYPETTSYLVRGYGQPHHNLYYNSLVLFAGNKVEKRANTRGQIIHTNVKHGSAISIEYPFKPNITYEVEIKASFYDNEYLIFKKFSNGYPTIYAQLKDDGIIALPNLRDQNQDPCKRKDLNDLNGYEYGYEINYTRTYTLDSRNQVEKTIIFKFSPTQEKKAILISLHPAMGKEGVESDIPINNYTMTLPLIKITEKTFDPSLNVDISGPINPRVR